MSHTIYQFRSPRGCLSYAISDAQTKECAIVDPSVELGDAYKKYLQENGLALRLLIETHTHADHISASPALREKTGALILMHERAPSPRKDRGLKEGDTIAVGAMNLRVLETPGHTDDSLSLILDNTLFTGDALLIGACGRTDFQGGSAEELARSLWDKILTLPDDLVVYPGHNYRGETSTTIGAEKQKNPRLLMGREGFVAFMREYHPPKPDLFDDAIRENSQ